MRHLIAYDGKYSQQWYSCHTVDKGIYINNNIIIIHAPSTAITTSHSTLDFSTRCLHACEAYRSSPLCLPVCTPSARVRHTSHACEAYRSSPLCLPVCTHVRLTGHLRSAYLSARRLHACEAYRSSPLCLPVCTPSARVSGLPVISALPTCLHVVCTRVRLTGHLRSAYLSARRLHACEAYRSSPLCLPVCTSSARVLGLPVISALPTCLHAVCTRVWHTGHAC